MGSAFAKAKRAYESSFQEAGKAINEKVRLYVKVGQALIEAKVAGGDPFEAIERLMTWEQFTESGRFRGVTPLSWPAVALYLNRRLWPFTALNSWTDFTSNFGLSHCT